MANPTPANYWQMVCNTCGKRGPKRATKTEALQDALEHQNANPGHTVEVEYTQAG